MLIGAHVSTAGGLLNVLERAEDTRSDAIQIFNQSPRMWRPTKYTEEDFAAFREGMEQSRLQAVMIHMIYLINPATKDREMRKKSLDSLTHALRVGEGIGAIGVVVHPGALKDDTRANAKKRAIKLIKEALAETESCPIFYENTAGSPQLLGRDFDETAELIEKTGGPKRLGLCIDTCHLHATGYDVRTPEGVGRDRRRDRRQDRPEAAEGDPPERLARRARLQPRPPRRDRQGRDRPQGVPRLPREPRFQGVPTVLEGAGARRPRGRPQGRAADPPAAAGGDQGPLVSDEPATAEGGHWAASGSRCSPGSALASINIWTGAPLLAVWVGSQIQAAQDRLSMTALLAVVATLAVTVFLLAWLLAYFNGRYDELIGRSQKARYTSPWLRSMRGEREEDIRREVGISGVERIVILAVVAAALAFEVWFFFFAGSSLPNQ